MDHPLFWLASLGLAGLAGYIAGRCHKPQTTPRRKSQEPIHTAKAKVKEKTPGTPHNKVTFVLLQEKEFEVTETQFNHIKKDDEVELSYQGERCIKYTRM